MKILLFVFFLAFFGCSTLKNTENEKCDTYILIPPHHDSLKISDFLAEEWALRTQKQLKKCDRIVPYEESKKIFSLLNIDHQSEMSGKSIPNHQLERINKKSKVTRLVILNLNSKKHKLEINPIYYNFYPLKKIEEKKVPKKYFSKIPAKKYEAASTNASTFMFNYIPNSFTLNLLDATSNAAVTSDYYSVETTTNHSNIPQIISRFGLTDVIHPFGFKAFDTYFNSYLSLNFFFADSTIHLVKKDELQEEANFPVLFDYRYRHYSIAPAFNLGANFFSFLGTTSLSIGLATVIYYHKDDIGNDTSGVVIGTRFTFGHRVFFSERVFMDLKAEIVSLSMPVVKNEYFQYDQIGSVFFGFGYYYPELRRLLK